MALLASYWGKADPEVALAGVSHHTILGHSLDVAACAYALIDTNPILRRQLSDCSGTPIDAVAMTCAATCALHDVGKIDTRFQRKAAAIADSLRPLTATIPRGPYDHGTEGFRQIEDDLEASAMLHERLGAHALPILRAVCGHHGGLPLRDEPDPTRTNLPGAVRREDATARRIFLRGVLQFFVDEGAVLPWLGTVDAALVQRLAGLCAVADWIGSNVQHFPYKTGPIADVGAYWAQACTRASVACGAAGLRRATAASVGFTDLFPGYEPRDVQLLTERVSATSPALIIVEGEMGKGKTEAAMAIAARFLGAHFVDGLTVALPTMATSNAMLRRVEQMIPNLFPAGSVQLALAHGRASRQSSFRALTERALRAHDPDAPEASVMCARWLLNKKRILLAQVGVGTVDQALQAALLVRHQFVRMFGLSRNVVIIDEVHAYDAYMEVLLEHLLAWLGELHVPVVLLSATLPSERRAALARAWLGPAGDRQAIPIDDHEAARARPYPLVSVTTRERNVAIAGDSTPTSRTVLLERTTWSGHETADLDAIASRLVDAARGGARIVWIRNTVREAQRAFGAVAVRAVGVDHLLFHARFRGCDRDQIERAVLERFGKAADSGGRVLIATQVVEQSLDLDFDEMHTDLAPVDLLFQRVGRLHRHTRPRPAGFELPRLVVHGPSRSDADALQFGPSRFVYDAGTLWLADRALRSRDHLRLPDDIRPLVEESYHPDSRRALLPLAGHRLVEAEQRREDELTARRTKARRCCIPATTSDPDGQSVGDDDPDAVQAFTRDGMSATLLPFAWDGATGRALTDASDTAAWRLDAARADAWRLAGDLIDQTLSLPARGGVEGLVSARETPAWNAWRRSFARFAEEGGLGSRVAPLPMKRDGDAYKGWLRMGGTRRRVLYTPSLGLLMPSERNEEQAR